MSTFQLQDYGTLHALRQQRHTLNSTLPILPTSTSGQGCHIPLLKYLEWHISRLPASVAPSAEPILLKLAFDGATITKARHIQQELGGFQLLHPEEALSSLKSPQTCHVWVVYLGGESWEELVRELESTVEVRSPALLCTDVKLLIYACWGTGGEPSRERHDTSGARPRVEGEASSYLRPQGVDEDAWAL